MIDFRAERLRAAKRAGLVLLLLAGWTYAAYGPAAFRLRIRLGPERAAEKPRSRTAVSWENGGKPLEGGD